MDMKKSSLESTHSHGPWTCNHRGEIYDAENCIIGSVFTSGQKEGNVSHEECESNGILMSAAPELLEAARSCLRWIPENLERVDGKPSSRDRLVEAIRKAMGICRMGACEGCGKDVFSNDNYGWDDHGNYWHKPECGD